MTGEYGFSDGGGALGDSCDLCSRGAGLVEEDLWEEGEGAGAGTAGVDVKVRVAARVAVDVLGSRTPLREAAAMLEEEALTSMLSRSICSVARCRESEVVKATRTTREMG